MPSSSAVEFHWASPLGLSVGLFLLYGFIYLAIGSLTPILLNSAAGPRMLIISPRTDAIVFGRPPADLLRDDPALFQLRTILLRIIGGLLFAAGCLLTALAWFGLRQGQLWALVALAVGGLGVLPFWLLALRPYFAPGVNLGLADLPPFMWVPAALLLPAIVFGWIGLH